MRQRAAFLHVTSLPAALVLALLGLVLPARAAEAPPAEPLDEGGRRSRDTERESAAETLADDEWDDGTGDAWDDGSSDEWGNEDLAPEDLEALGDLDDIDGTVVTGSRIRRGVDDTPGAERVGEARIAESGADTLAELLERVAGVQVQSSLGTGTEVMLDGLDGKFVLVLIDGQPVNGLVDNRVDLDRLAISVQEIEHVDVVRGPMSAVYGSQALGGVIHIVTRRPSSAPKVYAQLGTRLQAGGLGRQTVQVAGSGGVGPLVARLSLSGLWSDALDRGGTKADGSLTRLPDGVYDLPHRRMGDARLALTLYALPELTLRSTLWVGASQLETRQSALLPARDATDTTQVDAVMSAEWAPTADQDVHASARISRFTHRFARIPDGSEKDAPPFCHDEAGAWRFFDPACSIDPRVRSDAVQDLGRFELIHRGRWLRDLPWARTLDTAAGAVLELEQGRRLDEDGEDTLQGRGSRALVALYGEARYVPMDGLSLSPGLRVDGAFPSTGAVPKEDESAAPVFGLGPKLSARVDLPLGLFVQGAVGQGFRVPSFLEQHLRFDHSELGYVVEGNPELLPERSTGFRLEAGLGSGRFSLRGEAFLNLIQDLIAERIVGQNDAGIPIYTYENLDRAWTGGLHLRAAMNPLFGFSFEAGVQWLPLAHDLTGCGDLLFCDEKGGAERLPLRAELNAHASARYTVEASRTTAFTQAQLLGPRIYDDGLETPTSLLWSLGVRQALPGELDLTVSLDNALDDYHPLYGPKPGASVRMALRGAWGAS